MREYLTLLGWAQMWERDVKPEFLRFIEAVKDPFPEIHAGVSARVRTGREKFFAYANFMFGDPANADEDLIVQINCGPVDWAFSQAFPNAHGQDAIGFEVWGDELFGTVVKLEPLLLPEDEDSPQYESDVRGYIDKAMALLRQRTPDVIEALGRLKASRPPPGPPLPRVRRTLPDSE